MSRPTVFTKETLHKLEHAFSLDCTDEESCLYADISPSTLYAYQTKNERFMERKRLLKQQPVLKARTELVKGLEGNPLLSLRYLERKRRDEFAPSTDTFILRKDTTELDALRKTILDSISSFRLSGHTQTTRATENYVGEVRT